jgi:hypothetical protein
MESGLRDQRRWLNAVSIGKGTQRPRCKREERKEEVRDEWNGKGRCWNGGGTKGLLLFKCVEGVIVKANGLRHGEVPLEGGSGSKPICHLITPMNLAGDAEGEEMCCMWKWLPDSPSIIDRHRTNISEVSAEC